MFFQDGSTELKKLLKEFDSPRSAFWFPLVVLASAWYTTIWLAWWLGTPSPEGNIRHIEACVHFGAMTAAILVMIHAGPFGIMPRIDFWFWLLIAVSSLIWFFSAIFGQGYLFRNGDLGRFLLQLSEHRQDKSYLFTCLLSMLAVVLTFVSVWSMLSVLVVSVRFCGTNSQLVSKELRISRLGLASFSMFLLLPTLYILREQYPILASEPANSMAYSRWLFQVLLASGFLWCTCLLMTRFQRQLVRLGVGLFVVWFSMLLFWASPHEFRQLVSGSWESTLFYSLGFSLHWSLAMGALYLDGKMPVAEPLAVRREHERSLISANPAAAGKGNFLEEQNSETPSEAEIEQTIWLDESDKLPSNLASLYVATDEFGQMSGWVDDSTWNPDHKRTWRLREVFAKSRLRWLRALPFGYIMQSRSEAEEFLTHVRELEHLDIEPSHGISPWVLSWISEQPLQSVIVRGSETRPILDSVLQLPTLRRLAVPYHQLDILEDRLSSLGLHQSPLDIFVFYRDSDVARSQAWQQFTDFHTSISRFMELAGTFSGVTIRFCEGLPFAGYFGTPGELVKVTPVTASDIERKIAIWAR